MSRRQERQVPDTFGYRVRLARLERGLTQEKLAREVDVTLRTVQRWEDNTAAPGSVQLLGLAMALGVTIDSLYPEPEVAA